MQEFKKEKHMDYSDDGIGLNNTQKQLIGTIPIYDKNKIDQNLEVTFDNFDDTWKFVYLKRLRIEATVIIEIIADNIDTNGKPILKSWRLLFIHAWDDNQLQSIEIKTEKKSYLIVAKNHVATIINLPLNMFKTLNSLNEEQQGKMKDQLSDFDNLINILDIGDFKIRLNNQRGSITFTESSIGALKDYCIGFLEDINVDVRSVLNKEPEILNNKDEFALKPPQNKQSFESYGKVLFITASLVFVFFVISILIGRHL
jgi:hypothetical protein